jgi:redox-sensitive bicupin YhaK (pirin superfamily)
MLRIRRSEERGHADHGWLDTYHTFSFADYFDEEHMSFGELRVLNQDRVRGGRGFGTHGHRDMEIVSVVLEGVLEHKDSMGNGSRMVPGDVQLMSAGTGVTHSEFNGSEKQPVHFLQMWVLPRTQGTKPRYEQKHFADEERRGRLKLVVAPDGRDGALTIAQDARLYLALLGAGERAEHALAPGRGAYVHVARGSVRLDGQRLGPGDGAAVEDARALALEGEEQADVVLWDLGL